MQPPLLTAADLNTPPVRHVFTPSRVTIGDLDAYLQTAGLVGAHLVQARQVHGNRVLRVRSAGDAEQEQDAMVTDRPGLALTIRTADCLPVLLADPQAGVVGAAHAGWRGTRLRVVQKTVEAMLALGARVERLRAALGPAIEPDCYQVGAEVVAAYRQALPGSSSRFGRSGRHLDLAAVNQDLLLEAGLDLHQIEVLRVCTRCDARFASYRRDGTARSENLSLIALAD
jgi:YfiH family protein